MDKKIEISEKLLLDLLLLADGECDARDEVIANDIFCGDIWSEKKWFKKTIQQARALVK